MYAGADERSAASWWELDLPHARLGIGLSPETSRGFSGEGALLDTLGDRSVAAADAVRGRLGYDLAEGRYFARLLPVGIDLLDEQPRLVKARALLERDGVRPEGDHHVVRGQWRDYVVRLAPDGDRCTCTWYVDHQGSRGPCAHVLAVRLLVDGSTTTDEGHPR